MNITLLLIGLKHIRWETPIKEYIGLPIEKDYKQLSHSLSRNCSNFIRKI